MQLSPKEREDAFPIHIDLGKKESDMGGAVPEMAAKGKKGKPRVFHPTVYIDNVPGLEQLPKEGCMLVEYRRKSLRIDEQPGGEETTGVTLELRRICLAENSDESDDESDDLASAFKMEDMKKSDDEAYSDEDEE